ncbi:hypothetical protein SGFS_061610 [Streptomyces graminofaciens]|uniref:Uncharacterized protein n=1 Tax=Streptomyces graminofaciens TaxID=68212 RepID=A0ABM7FF63_9ACTN|nr:hypothetical protein SGFS_061610 [Streptomyces graminofaciens]
MSIGCGAAEAVSNRGRATGVQRLGACRELTDFLRAWGGRGVPDSGALTSAFASAFTEVDSPYSVVKHVLTVRLM